MTCSPCCALRNFSAAIPQFAPTVTQFKYPQCKSSYHKALQFQNQPFATVTTSKYSGKCDWEMPYSVFLGVVVLFSSGCRCGVGFCFPFRSFMFSLFRSDFWVVFSLCALFTLGGGPRSAPAPVVCAAHLPRVQHDSLVQPSVTVTALSHHCGTSDRTVPILRPLLSQVALRLGSPCHPPPRRASSRSYCILRITSS